MKVAVDYQSARAQKTGIGVFASSLFSAIEKEKSGIEFIFYETASDLNTPGRILWESARIPLKLLRDKPDLVYSPGFCCALLAPARKVVTVHDLIGLAYPRNQRGFAKVYWSTWLPNVLKSAQCLVASSESTRRDIGRFLKIPADRVEVVPLAARVHFTRLENKGFIERTLTKYNVPTPYFISVGSLEPRKNLMTLLGAFEKLSAQKADVSLVIVGKPAGAENELKNFIKEKSLGARVKILGYVTDEELVALYNGALAYAMLSFYEGFGLPVLEAMSCGLAGVVSDNSSLVEVAGDTALKVSPHAIEAVADALKTLIQDERGRLNLAAAAVERSQNFSMKKTAEHMIRIFRKECG